MISRIIRTGTIRSSAKSKFKFQELALISVDEQGDILWHTSGEWETICDSPAAYADAITNKTRSKRIFFMLPITKLDEEKIAQTREFFTSHALFGD